MNVLHRPAVILAVLALVIFSACAPAPPIPIQTRPPASPTPTAATDTPSPTEAATSTSTPSPTNAPESQESSVWVQNDQMTIYSKDGDVCLKHGSNEPVRLDHIITDYYLRVSDDHSMFAFVQMRFVETGSESIRTDDLWVADADGSDMRLLLSSDDIPTPPDDTQRHSLIHEVQWLPGGHQLLLTSSYTYTANEPENPGNDLIVVDADTGAHGNLLNPGDGGVRFYPSPDGEQIAVIRYDELADGKDAVGLIKSDGTDWREKVFTYPSRVCHCGIYPDLVAVPVWKPDSTGFWIAVPPADEMEGDQTATTWYVPVDGSPAQKLGEIGPIKLSSFSARLEFSPDGMWVAYEGMPPDAVRQGGPYTELHFVRPDGSEDMTYLKADQHLSFIGWEPDSRSFHFQTYDPPAIATLWRGELGGSYEEVPRALPPHEGCSS